MASAAPANAAVMVSGSTIDSSGNYVEGFVRVYAADGTPVTGKYADSGAFDIPLENGTYKLQFLPSSEFAPEYYRDKADLTTADVVTVSGTAQTLAPWTIDRQPSVLGVLRTADGRAVRDGTVRAYDATTGNPLGSDDTDGTGAFRIGTAATSVKLAFSGYDPDSYKLLASEYYNDKASLATADAVAPTAAGADVGVVTLAPGGSIAGRITNDFGAPLHRAEACVDGPYSVICDWTDPNGYYLIEGVNTGSYEVEFRDPLGEYVGEYWNNVSYDSTADPNPVTVAPGQAVVNIDAALAAAPVTAPNGVDVSGTVRDELGNLGVGYIVKVYDTPADPRDRKVVAQTYSNRAGQYNFTQLDRIGGETEFKLVADVQDKYNDSGPREEDDFARRSIWSGNKLGYETASVVTAAPSTVDFTLPVAGGVSGAVTSDAGGVAKDGFVNFYDADNLPAGGAGTELDGTYDDRTVWAGEYTVLFGAYLHVPEWWKDALPEDATTITVKPGQMTTGISAALSKDVKAIERPEVEGNAWVGKTLNLDAGRWNTQTGKLSYEWLSGTTVIATGSTLKLTKSLLGKKLTGRITNDAGFAQGQALTKTTAKVGYQPKVRAKVSGKRIGLTITAKPLKSKKVNATVVAYEVKGKRANGELKLKKLGKGKAKLGVGTVTLKKALGKGKHKLVLRIKGKGKVGSGDITKVVKLKR